MLIWVQTGARSSYAYKQIAGTQPMCDKASELLHRGHATPRMSKKHIHIHDTVYRHTCRQTRPHRTCSSTSNPRQQGIHIMHDGSDSTATHLQQHQVAALPLQRLEQRPRRRAQPTRATAAAASGAIAAPSARHRVRCAVCGGQRRRGVRRCGQGDGRVRCPPAVAPSAGCRMRTCGMP